MLVEPKPRLPTWTIVLVALGVPILIAFGFLLLFGWANEPMSVAEYQSDPHMGQKIADRNNALVLFHGLAQLTFLTVGAWRVASRPRIRMLFLLVAAPVSVLAFLVTLVGLLVG